MSGGVGARAWCGGLVAVGAIVALLAPPTAGSARALEVSVPPPTGPHQLGTRALALVDRKRVDTPGSRGPRRLMVQVTYPRAQERSSPCRPAPYVSERVKPILAAAVGVNGDVDVNTGVCRGGRIARGRRPVLIFSHAFTANRSVYATLLNDLASRGYVVFAIDHPPDAFAIEYPRGRLVEGSYGRPLAPAAITAEELGELNELRAGDVRFVLRKAIRLGKRRSGFLAGHVDRRRIGAFGHSLGGSTAARAAQIDKRIDAAVDVDGSLFGDWTRRTGSKTPFMLLAAEGGIGANFRIQPLCSYMAGLKGPRFAFVLENAMHFSYSDFQSLAPQMAAANPLWQFALLYPLVVGTIDPEASIEAQREMLATFFARYVKRRPGARKPAPVGGFAEMAIGGCAA